MTNGNGDGQNGAGAPRGALRARARRRRSLAGGPVTAMILGALTGMASAQDAPLSFGARGSVITVDVVVVDRDGVPVGDLRRDDFAISEDGHAQTIVGFEHRQHPRGGVSEAAPAAIERPGASNADDSAAPSRVFAVLIDDLGLSPLVAQQVRASIETWIVQAPPDDEITLVTTSGEVWWSDRVARGREDLLAALARVKGLSRTSSGGDAMSDWEAYRIAAFEESTEGLVDPRARSRLPEFVGTTQQGQDGIMFYVQKLTGSSMVERVTERWLDNGICSRCVDPAEMSLDCKEIRVCRAQIQARANEVYAAWQRHSAAVYDTLTRLSRGLEGTPGRKSIMVVSEELFEDSRSNLSAKAIDASQRANTAIYFLGARGLTTTSLYSAAAKSAARPQDVGTMSLEQGFLATAGGIALAEDTGGTATTTSNDLSAALRRMTDDSSSYYLLGYQPGTEPDGKWHALEVKIRRPGVEVRARRRYLASKAEAMPSGRQVDATPVASDAKAGRRSISPTLLAGDARSGLPLRLAALIQEPSDDGRARVQVVVEIDKRRVRVDRSSEPWRAALDLTIMTASAGRHPIVPVDERLDLSLDPQDAGSGWWLVSRDVWLPPGVAQIRAHVRDAGSGLSGLVTERLTVPALDQAYLSTPLLTDRVLPTAELGQAPRLVPTASRVFGRRPQLFCQFEAFLYGAWNLPDAAQLTASHALSRPDGTIVASSPPTPVEIGGTRAVRRITLPTQDLAAGPYALTLTVRDLVGGKTLTASAPFLIERE